MSSCFADERASIPGKDVAIVRNSACRVQVSMAAVFSQMFDVCARRGERKFKRRKRSRDLDVEAGLRAGFDEEDAVLLRLGFPFVSRHLPSGDIQVNRQKKMSTAPAGQVSTSY
jgi:hypothetical protein